MWPRPADRRLMLTSGGKWYLALTLFVGVAAVSSGNNVIYLMESFLLGVLVLSGLLSEFTLRGISLEWHRGQARAGEAMPDVFLVKSSAPAFGVEVGVVREGALEAGGWFAALKRGGRQACHGGLRSDRRGVWRWERLYVATSFPLGMGKKVRFLGGAGSRVVWPRALSPRELAGSSQLPGAAEFLEGEVRELEWGDDFRLVHGPLSARGGSWVGRVRGRDGVPGVVEVRRQENAEEWEKEVARAAGAFYRWEARRLVVLERAGRRSIDGRRQALDWLSTEEV
ncbi:MAG: hypothetical protein HUU37_03690 [Bdellovibrionales bacterium]|nr:hypothetical protein [Bdellovibrionales bacterium]